MVIGIKALAKLFAITIVACCAVFVCTLFLNYNLDIVTIKDEITSPQGVAMYGALVASGKVVAAVSGGCLLATIAVMLVFYIKNYVDSHGKELGILKALGYSNFSVARHFWAFGLSVFAGCLLGYAGAAWYLPVFYRLQNKEGLFPALSPQLHWGLACCVILLPTAFFMILSVLYALFKMKRPALKLLKEVQERKYKINRAGTKDLPFLLDLRKSTLKSRKILVFFVGFSGFCFSAMTQMSMSMTDLSSEAFSWMMLSIGLILAFMTLLMSLTSVVKANAKTIAMMKVLGYSQQECGKALLGGYRPVAYIGFAIGTVYQFALLKIMVSVVFAGLDNMPEYRFDFEALLLSLAGFLLCYELLLFCYAKRIGNASVKGIMLE